MDELGLQDKLSCETKPLSADKMLTCLKDREAPPLIADATAMLSLLLLLAVVDTNGQHGFQWSNDRWVEGDSLIIRNRHVEPGL